MMTSSFSPFLAICTGNSPVTGEFPSQRRVTRNFDVSLICAWTNGWVNNRQSGGLRRHWDHYDVTVMEGSFVVQWRLMATEIWINIVLDNGLLLHGVKPLSGPMLTNHQWPSLDGNFTGHARIYLSSLWKLVWKLMIWVYSPIPHAPMSLEHLTVLIHFQHTGCKNVFKSIAQNMLKRVSSILCLRKNMCYVSLFLNRVPGNT